MDIDFIIRAIVTVIAAVGFGILWKSLFILIAQKVEISIGDNEIILHSKNKTISLLPYVHIAKEKKRYKLLGIGKLTTSESEHDYYSVNILSPESNANSHTEIKECVEAFFRTAFYQLFDRRILLYTQANVKGAEKFKTIFGDNWQETFDKCLEVSGSIKREYT